MSLHQRIIDRVTAEPCNCSEDDDHFDYVTEELPVEDEVKGKERPERIAKDSDE